MKLFYSTGSCSLSPHIALLEAGLKFDLEKVDLATKKTTSGDFTKINPKGYVPALVLDNGDVLTEGAVIVQYIADQKPEAKLLPKAGTFERYRAQEWLNFISTEIHKGFSPLFNKDIPEASGKMIRENLAKRFEFLAQHFSKNSFLMGTQYTVADGYLFTVMSWSEHLKFDLTKWPTLMGFFERVKTRPATHAAMKSEGLIK